MRVLVYKKPNYQSGNIVVNMKLASKIYIHTPVRIDHLQIPTIIPMIIVIIFGPIFLYSLANYIKKKQKTLKE